MHQMAAAIGKLDFTLVANSLYFSFSCTYLSVPIIFSSLQVILNQEPRLTELRSFLAT